MIRVLIGCESSGVIRDAFRAAGFDAWSCDLLDCEGDPTYHIKGDVFEQLTSGRWDVFIVHPDCTFLTNSAAWAYKDGPYHQKVKPGTLVGEERRKAREKALGFVRKAMAAPCLFIALENPVGVISTMINARDFGFSHSGASQYIHPHEYGHDASKKTGLWLKNLPPLVPTKNIPPPAVGVLWVDVARRCGEIRMPKLQWEQHPVAQVGESDQFGAKQTVAKFRPLAGPLANLSGVGGRHG